jgi:hypothetical protein
MAWYDCSIVCFVKVIQKEEKISTSESEVDK